MNIRKKRGASPTTEQSYLGWAKDVSDWALYPTVLFDKRFVAFCTVRCFLVDIFKR